MLKIDRVENIYIIDKNRIFSSISIRKVLNS